jgi:hypothetical protein
MTKTRILFSFLFFASLGIVTWTLGTVGSPVEADDAKPADNDIQPVDDDMHHFMEYVFEPNYKRLKAAMATEPSDKQAWKGIKGDALTLAECANLLVMRVPENGYGWKPYSLQVRGYGSQLYQAARKSDYPAARKAYTSMLQQCNACHKKFADGEHQLTP